jgi:hypothetical protein
MLSQQDPQKLATVKDSRDGHESMARNRVGVLGIVFFVVAVAAPLTVVVALYPVIIGSGNGIGIAGTFILVALVLTVFAVGYVAMSKHITNTGAFYAYITKGLGRPLGLGSASLAVFGYNAIQLGVTGRIRLLRSRIRALPLRDRGSMVGVQRILHGRSARTPQCYELEGKSNMSADGVVDLRKAQPLDPDEVVHLVHARFGLSVTDAIALPGQDFCARRHRCRNGGVARTNPAAPQGDRARPAAAAADTGDGWQPARHHPHQ